MILDEKVAATFRQLARDQESGLLVWEGRDVKRQVFFEQGLMVSVRSSLEKERLGQLLVRHGRITAEQLLEATRFIPSGMRLGQILVELGYLNGGEIERYVRLNMLEVACGMLDTAPERLAFSDQVDVQADTLTPLPVADVFMEAVRRIPDLGAYQSVLARPECRLRLSADLLRTQRVSLSPEETFILSRMEQSASARALTSGGPFSEEQMVRILVGFVYAGLVELQLEQQPIGPGAIQTSAAPQGAIENEICRLFEAFQCVNHWQVLGVQRGASPEELERAYEEKTSRYRSDQFQQIVDLDFQEKLSFVLARIREAYTVLTTRTEASHYGRLAEMESEYEKGKSGSWDSPKDKDRAAAPARKDPQEAKRLFQRAKRALAASDYWEAVQLCRAAIELGENDPEHFHLLGQALAHNPKWRRDAEQNLNIAIKLSPWQPKYHVALAELYHREGLNRRSRRVLEQVATIDPNYPIPRFGADPEAASQAEATGDTTSRLIRKLTKTG